MLKREWGAESNGKLPHLFIHSLSKFNLSLRGAFTRLTRSGPYRATTCRERELTLDHIHTFLTTQGHGEPPRMREQLNAVVTSETTRTWKSIQTSLLEQQPWFLSLQWKTCLRQNCSLVSRACSEEPALGQNTDVDYNRDIYIGTFRNVKFTVQFFNGGMQYYFVLAHNAGREWIQ